MKSHFLAASLLGVAVLTGCPSDKPESSGDGSEPAAAVVPEGMTKVVLSVPDMH